MTKEEEVGSRLVTTACKRGRNTRYFQRHEYSVARSTLVVVKIEVVFSCPSGRYTRDDYSRNHVTFGFRNAADMQGRLCWSLSRSAISFVIKPCKRDFASVPLRKETEAGRNRAPGGIAFFPPLSSNLSPCIYLFSRVAFESCSRGPILFPRLYSLRIIHARS